MTHLTHPLSARLALVLLTLGLFVTTSIAGPTKDQWQSDIDMLAEKLLERHPNFFTKHTVEEFEDALDSIIERLPTHDDAQVVMDISKLVAMGGDAHTSINPTPYTKKMHRLPIQVIALADGVFISAATQPYQDLIGAQIIKFGSTPTPEAFEKISALFAYENQSRLINSATSYITLLPALQAVGLADDFKADSYTLTIKDDQGQRSVTLDCTLPKTRQSWVSFAQAFRDKMPLMYRKSNGNYQTEFLPDSKAMYLAYNQCKDAEDFPMKLLVEFIAEKSEELDAQRLIIDLRFNGGGDETVLWPMMDMLKESKRFNKPGDIVVLISRYTFSSAMTNAHQLKERTGAILIGEPTGGKPNHFGQLDSFILPNSKITVSYSTKWFQKVEGDPDAVYPDILIEVGSEDFFAGNDPVLEAALTDRATESTPGQTPNQTPSQTPNQAP